MITEILRFAKLMIKLWYIIIEKYFKLLKSKISMENY